jgi:hypothetical protein
MKQREGDLNIPLSLTDRSSRTKTTTKTRYISELNRIVDQMDLPNIYRILYPIATGIHILLSSPWNSLQNHIKMRLN